MGRRLPKWEGSWTEVICKRNGNVTLGSATSASFVKWANDVNFVWTSGRRELSSRKFVSSLASRAWCSVKEES
ncbi:MAG: hypothetical protein ACTS80_01935 [Candidatus Hodgkinia cicadicola]